MSLRRSPNADRAARKRKNFYEDYKREEAEWKAQLEAARLAAGEPPPPPPEKWKLPIHCEYDEYGFPLWPSAGAAKRNCVTA